MSPRRRCKEEQVAPAVIAEMSTELPHLTVGEAVMRMDLADAPVLLFRNRSHGELNLVYRRADGNIGWIDPELDPTRRPRRPILKRGRDRAPPRPVAET